MAIAVATAADLNNVRNNLAGNYIQVADIDLTGYANWLPIGDSTNEFTGIYDGNGFKITNLTINRPTTDNVGLFGYGSYALFKNIGIENCNVTGGDYVGGLVGNNCDGTVNNCYSTGNITGDYKVGGLIGTNWNDIVSDCYSTANISGNHNWVGGLIGETTYGTVNNCYSTGNITGNNCVGGLIGETNYNGELNNCYSKGNVSGYNSVGGLVGNNYGRTVNNCYSTGNITGDINVGGLIGYIYASAANNCYYDSQTSGQSDTGKGEPRTTAQMKQQATFVSWDFVTIWGISESITYPYLRAFVTIFEVTSTIPLQDANNVDPNSNIQITFSDSLDTSTISTDNLQVYGWLPDQYEYAWNYDDGTKTLTLTIPGGLETDASIIVNLTDGLKSTGGTTLTPYALGFSTAKLPLQCDPPVILEPQVAKCAKPIVILQAPTPTRARAKWRLHFRIKSYSDDSGTNLISTVDSNVNPELFQYSPDNGCWREFPSTGLPKEQYGAYVAVRCEVGPRTQVWLRASVGAEDA